MTGYTAIYCVGGAGGYEGADGINSILFQMWQGDGSRQWLEVHYFDNSIQPIGNIRNIVPAGPDSPTMLLDACLAFFPRHFESCPSLPQVRDALRDAQHIDFDPGANAIPLSWNRLRAEAAPLLERLFIVKGELHPVHFKAVSHAAIAANSPLTTGSPDTVQHIEMYSAPTLQAAEASGNTDVEGAAERHPEPAPHVESLHAPDDIGSDANKELFGDHDKGEDVGPVG